MRPGDYLFPRRTRREFLQTTSVGLATLALAPVCLAEDKSSSSVKIGSGSETYTLDNNFGKLPSDMKYGLGCAIVVDSQDRVYVTSRSTNPCVAIYDKDGKLLETWSADFAQKVGYSKEQVSATAHGLYWSKEGNDEFFYFTENAGPNNTGRRIYKTDLTGKVLYMLGNVEKNSDQTQKFDFRNPTDVAVAPNGDIYIVDGYGSQKLSRFDKNFKHIKTIGEPGKAHGQFRTCHGVWINTLKNEPEVYVADRANDRIEVFSLDLEYKRTISDVRKPCCFYQSHGKLYIPELDARVTVLDADDKIIARLGDGVGDKEAVNKPEKFALPHALTVDSRGDLYVIEWVPFGRPRKFKHTPA